MQFTKIAATLLSVASLAIAVDYSDYDFDEDMPFTTWDVRELDFYCQPPDKDCKFFFKVVGKTDDGDVGFRLECSHDGVKRGSREYLPCKVTKGSDFIRYPEAYFELRPRRPYASTYLGINIGFQSEDMDDPTYYEAKSAYTFKQWIDQKHNDYSLQPEQVATEVHDD